MISEVMDGYHFPTSSDYLESKSNSFPNYGLTTITLKALADWQILEIYTVHVTAMIGGLSEQLKVKSGQTPY